MNKLFVLIVIPLLFLSNHVFAAPCDMYFKTEKLCLLQKWEVIPTRTTVGKMTLTFKDSQGRTISPVHTPSVLLWMPTMGHGSTPVTMTLVEDGIYSVTNVRFIMGGAWDIHYQLKDGNSILEEFIQKIIIH